MNRALASGPIVWLGIIVTTCLLLVLFQTILWLVLPVMMAIVANFMLSPLVTRAMTLGLSRTRAVLIVTVLLSVFLMAIGVIIGPPFSRATHNWRGKLDDYMQDGVKLVVNAQNSLAKVIPFMHRPTLEREGKDRSAPSSESRPKAPVPDLSDAKTTPLEEARQNDAAAIELNDTVATWTASNSSNIAFELLHWIPSLLLVPYLTYFFLLDGPRFKRFLVQAIPNAFFEKTLYLFYRVEDQLRRYFQGLMTLTTLDGLCLGIGLWILGIKAPFVLAGIAAVMAWLPYLGSIGGALLAVLVAARDSPENHLLPYEVVGLFVGVRLLDDFLFLPLTVGRSLHMHPLVTVLMILLGGAVAGISGLLLVMPVLGVVMVAGQIIGELVADDRILARHRHARELRRRRAKLDL